MLSHLHNLRDLPDSMARKKDDVRGRDIGAIVTQVAVVLITTYLFFFSAAGI